MERYSYFVHDKALFGGFPNQEDVNKLEKDGVRVFVDLTTEDERSETTPYNTTYTYIKYPIRDRKIPSNWITFAVLVKKVSEFIQNGEKVYVHCKGGHGRAGILVACVLCYLYKLSPDIALYMTNFYHSLRPGMSDKSRKLGSPQGKGQKNFVHKFFATLPYGEVSEPYNKGFCDFSPYSVSIHGVGTFNNAYEAYQEIRKQRPGVSDADCMYEVLQNKFRQHNSLKLNLLNTGFRPLLKISQEDFWGCGVYGRGENVHGKLLTKLRKEFLSE